MRLPRPILGSLAVLILLASRVGAVPPDPLRLVPDNAELIVEVKQPRHLIEMFTTLDLVKDVQKFDVVRDAFESTNVRQYFQLVAYFEKELAAKWPELLDKIGGGGAVLAVTYGSQPTPVLLVLQGTDEAATQKFARLALEVAEQELARQEAKDRPERGKYRDIETLRVGKEFHAAVAGAALLISNTEKTLHAALDRHLDGGMKSMAQVKAVADARQLLPVNPHAFAWLNMESIRKLPGAKEVFMPEAQDPNVTVLFGNILDVLKRTPYVSAGLYREKDGFLLTTRLPVGRDGSSPGMTLFIPPADRPGSRPLLEPKGVLFSTSYYMDVAKLWQERDKLFNKEQVKALEEFDKTSARFLSGNQFSKLLQQAGPYQRIVVVNQPTPGSYKVKPKQSIPAFAIVVELRDAEPFARSMETVVRGAALLAGTQVRLKLIEEKLGTTDIIGYHFDEKSAFPGDTQDLRFNFSPCIARVGSQYVFCSTLELCRELVDLLEKERKDIEAKSSKSSSLTRLYSAGGAELAKAFKDTLIAQTVLDQGVGTKEALKQVDGLIDLLRRVGVLNLEMVYEANRVRFDARLRLGK